MSSESSAPAKDNVIDCVSESRHDKWQLSLQVDVVPLMQMAAFPLPITAFRLFVQQYNEVCA